jgi:hypothetical protein
MDEVRKRINRRLLIKEEGGKKRQISRESGNLDASI